MSVSGWAVSLSVCVSMHLRRNSHVKLSKLNNRAKEEKKKAAKFNEYQQLFLKSSYCIALRMPAHVSQKMTHCY